MDYNDKDSTKKNAPRTNAPKKMDLSLANGLGKVQPQARALEEAVLGALMLDKDAVAVVVDILRAESFYEERHQKIYKAITQLFEASSPIDLLTTTEQIRKNGELDLIGGAYYLVELTNRVASSANVEYHARIISQKHIQRELIRISTEAINLAYEDTTDVFDLLDRAEQNLFSITEKSMSRGVMPMSTLVNLAIKQIEELSKKKDGLTGVPTGFLALDRLTSGWQPSDLIIIAARPAMGKCLAENTQVLLFDGRLKKVQDLRVGDLLMGDDSTPRRISSITTGTEQMYWVRQNKGIDYEVNESHILALKRSRNEGKHRHGNDLLITVGDYYKKSKKFRSNYKGYKVAVEFAAQPLPIEPYFLGLWLGDGTSSQAEVTTKDPEIVAYLEDFAQRNGWRVNCQNSDPNKCPRYAVTKTYRSRVGHSLQGQLREFALLKNKHIPHEYIANSTENRLQLLAGLLDSDGHYLVDSNGYEITQKNEELARAIKFLCDTLGFRTSFNRKTAQIKSTGYSCEVFRVRIYGDVDKIPLRLAYKRAKAWTYRNNWRATGIKVEKSRIGTYYGFEIDGNGLFLLEDMTVTHNTSLTLAIARNAAVDFGKPVAFFSLEMSSVQLVNRLIALETEISGEKLRKGQLESYEWQQLHVGISKLSNVPIFIDDTPALSVFELRAKCRRLKMQHDIQLIIVDYLQLMTAGGGEGKGNREQEIANISRSLKGLAKELNVPVIALSQLSRAVEVRGGSKRPQLSDLRESGCVTGDTLITNAQTGEQVTIKELAERSTQTIFPVMGMSEDLKVCPQNMVKAFYSGRKQVFELRTRTGKSIKASANHPFYKISGWTRLDELAVGDRIATPRALNVGNESSVMSKAISRNRLNAIHQVLPVDELAHLAQSDLYWDEIVDIIPLGVEDVYDATVEGVHNFVANDIIIHNSIEQDADIVGFIYRPEYYGITEDEDGNSLKGVGEIIIAKHRNGAVDSVRLKWDGQYAKFGNLDDADNVFGGATQHFSDGTSFGGFIDSGQTFSSSMQSDGQGDPLDFNTNNFQQPPPPSSLNFSEDVPF